MIMLLYNWRKFRVTSIVYDYDLIVLGFNDTSTLEGHNRNESEETEEIKTFPLYPYPLQG